MGSAFNNYIRDHIDPILGPLSYAYHGTEGNQPRTIHDAVTALRNFTLNNRHQPVLWVADTDIVSAFDALPHDKIEQAVQSHFAHQGKTPDPRATAFIHSLLEGYDYTTARRQAVEYLHHQGVDNPIIHGNPRPPNSTIGIPQGCALSGTFLNALLADVNNGAFSKLNGEGFLARYSDNVLIVSPSKTDCQRALDHYARQLHGCGLDIPSPHPLAKVNSIKAFWQSKSRAPFPWSKTPTSNTLCIPWIEFVGYKINRDGILGIRRHSLNREIRRLRQFPEQCRQDIDNYARQKNRNKSTHRIDGKTLLHRCLERLIARTAGTPYRFRPAARAGASSWSDRFPLIYRYGGNHQDLRRLDDVRRRTVEKLKNDYVVMVQPTRTIAENSLFSISAVPSATWPLSTSVKPYNGIIATFLTIYHSDRRGFCLIMATSTLAAMAQPLTLFAITRSAEPQFAGQLWENVMVFLGALALYLLFSRISQMQIEQSIETVSRTTYTDIARLLVDTDLASLETIGKESVFSRLTRDDRGLAMATTSAYRLTQSLLMIGGNIVLLLVVSQAAALVVLITAFTVFSVYQHLHRNLQTSNRKTYRAEDRFFTLARHYIDGSKEIRINRDKDRDLFHHYLLPALHQGSAAIVTHPCSSAVPLKYSTALSIAPLDW